MPTFGAALAPFVSRKVHPADTFEAARWLPNRHLMTIAGHLTRVMPRLNLWRERWELPDGDFLDVDRVRGHAPDSPLLVVCHGLESSSRAGYVRSVMALAQRRGFAAVALNFRGCSGVPNRLLRGYHSGETTDLHYAVARLAAERSRRSLFLVGFSLGGNVVTKYMGERGVHLHENVRGGAVVSVPFNLARCCEALDSNTPPARFYRNLFLTTLVPKAIEKEKRFPGCIDVRRIGDVRRLRDYDDAFTAPLHGFTGADDYYTRSSSGPFVPKVARPLLVISAEDDPFIPADAIPTRAFAENPNVTALVSKEGGHVAFVGGSPFSLTRWAEERVVAFAEGSLGPLTTLAHPSESK